MLEPTIIENFIENIDNQIFLQFLNKQSETDSLFYESDSKRKLVWNPKNDEIISIIKKYSIKFSSNFTFPMFPHIIGGVIYEKGASLSVHKDINLHLGCKDCKFGAVIYLNDDYIGGEIYFPNIDKEFHPQEKSLIYYPISSDPLDHIFDHGSKEIINGTKYVIPMCFTINKELADQDYIKE